MSLIPFGFFGSTQIATDQLILHLDAKNTDSYPGTGATWFDLTSNNSDATVTSTTWNSSGWFPFRQSSAGYADLTLVGVDATTPTLTVEVWIKAYDTLNNDGILFGFNTYDLYLNGSGALGFNTGGGDCYGISSTQVSTLGIYGNWKQFVCVMQQTTSYTNNKFYVNTSLQTLSQQAGAEDTGLREFSNGIVRINGWRNNTNFPYDEDVAIFRIYKKELTSAEIRQNFNAQRARFGI